MKIFTRISLAACFIVAALSLSKPADAQLLFGVSFDAKGDIKSTIQQGEQYLATIQEEYVAKVKQALTKVKSEVDRIKGKVLNIVGKIPGAKEFASTSSVDMTDYEAVKVAITDLFLQYPAVFTDSKTNTAYERKGDDFYYDTLVEIKASITGLESKLNTLRREVEAFTEEAMTAKSTGENNTAGSDAGNPVDYNVYMAAHKMNDILKVTEELMAMRNQYYALKLLREDKIVPAPKPQNTSALTIDSSEISGSTKLVFAQFMNSKSVDAAQASANASPDESSSGSSQTNIFVVPKTKAEPSPLAGSENELEALKRIADIQLEINSALDVHNLLQRLPEYKDLYKQHSLYKKLHEKAVSSVEKADTCVLRYVGRRYSEPNKVWFGQSSKPQSTCDYDSRKGLSGWAITTFKTANASVGSDIDMDIFAGDDVDTEKDSQTLVEPDIEKLEKEALKERQSDYYKTPSRDKEFANSIREVEQLNWLIGRKAAQILVEDQYSENPVYGKASHPFPLWNDQRSYYDQYLDGKYENMKAYLNELDLADTAIAIAQKFSASLPEDDESGAIDALNQVTAALENREPTLRASEKLVEEKIAAVDAIRQRENNELMPHQARRAELDSRQDALSKQISYATEEIEKLNDLVAKNKSTADSAYNELNIMEKRGANTFSSGYIMAKQSFEESSKARLENMEELNKQRVLRKRYENSRATVQKSLDKVDTDIEKIQQKYRDEIISVESEYDTKIANLQTDSATTPKLQDLFAELNINNSKALGFIKKADSLVDTARSCAIEFIQKHQDELNTMKEEDALYMNSNNPSIVSKHAALTEQLTNLPRKCFERSVRTAIGTASVNAESIIALLREIFKPSIEDVCSKFSCTTADTQYFVGLPAKEHDFTAPKAPLTAHYPTVRDIVHLDTTDYKKLDVSSDGRLSHQAFLEYGLTQPHIWELLLSDNAYVEKGVDLSVVLERGGEGKSFVRGVQLPCTSDDRYIIDGDDSGKYSVIDVKKQPTAANQQKYRQLTACKDIKIKGRQIGIGGVINTYVIRDNEIENKKHRDTYGNAAGSVSELTNSELGMFLKYKDGVLSVNDLPHYGYTMLIKKEEKAEKDGKYDLTAYENIYQRAMFTTNQIGDFLHFVDKEMEVKKNVDEIEANMTDFKKNLKETFEKVNFAIKDNVDFSDNNDYKYIANKLKEQKNVLMSRISKDLDSVVHDNNIVKERYEKVYNTYKALLQDNDARVNLTTNTEAGSTLEQSIKTAKANEKVIEKSRKEGYDAIQKEIDNYEQPVCMPY